MRVERQKAYNPCHNSTSRNASVEPTDHAGPGSTDNKVLTVADHQTCTELQVPQATKPTTKTCHAYLTSRPATNRRKQQGKAFFIQ
jgi:hypothetical protein